MYNSKIKAWCAMAIAVALLITTFGMRTVWWQFIDIFFIFMAAFTGLLSVYFKKVHAAAARKLTSICLVCCVLGVVAFIVEYFVMQ